MLWQDAATWLVNSPDESLAFILADNGFDVWLVSTRGTKYSSGHTSLSPSDAVLFNEFMLLAYDTYMNCVTPLDLFFCCDFRLQIL